MIIRTAIFAPVAAVLLTGCMSMSGLDASSSFSCKAAPGVNCQSISGVQQNSAAGNLPFQRQENGVPADSSDGKSEPKPYAGSAARAEGKVSPRDMNAQYSGMPVRQPPLVLRVWMAPYEDESGDLHDQSYFYTMVHSGKWMIESNRNAISNQFKPIYPLTKPSAANQEPHAEKEAQPLVQKQQYENLVDKPNGQ